MTARLEIARALPLHDVDVKSDGRTVVAYVAMFDDPYEVYDEEGHYYEQINRAAFNRTITPERIAAVPLFNHGKTLYGTPSERYSMPLGTRLDVQADTKGLVTTTRYAETPLGDEVLELIRTDGLTGWSFRGPIFDSKRAGRMDDLLLVERTELGLRDYGPCTFPMSDAPKTVAVRAVSDVTNTELNDALRLAVQDRFVPAGTDIYAWVDDFSLADPLWVIYCLDGHYYRIGYTVAADGTVTLTGDPVEVERDITWIDISPSASSSNGSAGTSTSTTDTSPAGRSAPSPSDLDLLQRAQDQRRRRSLA